MAKIETIRHSLSHILAMAVQELYPGVKFGIGPAIENGFYYDFDFIERDKGRLGRITSEDLPRVEKRMRQIIKKGIKFKKRIISKEEAERIFKSQPYKLELIKEIPEKKVSVYQSGDFIDLCRGPHIKSTKEIDASAFRLARMAGAYWRGSEKNKMLTRIYGLAFQTKKELADFLAKEKEAEKRDHRVLGKKLNLFHIDENVGPGLILWHPKGAVLKRIIENYALEEYSKNGYQLVSTPHIAKLNLWKTSGHTRFYQENMFPPFHMAELGQEEKDDYQIKPMNCPFHIAIYKTKIRSYRDLPIRYTELGTVYRYEKSGVLHGLTRARGFTQDDAHIFCSAEQLSKELISVFRLTSKILKRFGFKDLKIYLSTRPKKFVGTEKMWRRAENSLKYALKKLKLNYCIDRGGGAFYGPKIDIKIEDALGREWQCTTIQVDFNLPERFDVTYIDQKGKKKRPIMIHRALLGSIERFIGVLLEYYGGALPLWLSPEQVWVIPVANRHIKYAKKISKELAGYGLRVRLKDEKETVSRKIREGEIEKIPYLLVVGDKEEKRGSVRIRQQGKGDIGEVSLTAFLKKAKIKTG